MIAELQDLALEDRIYIHNLYSLSKFNTLSPTRALVAVISVVYYSAYGVLGW